PHRSVPPPPPHSFPTRRSSDLALDRANIANGPVWRAQIAVGGSCPECGQGSISSNAWDGSRLYVAGGNTTINGNTCKGSLRALEDRKSTRLNSSHFGISYAVFC